MKTLLRIILLATATAIAWSPASANEGMFEDVSASAGIEYAGQSWGSAWGDFNGDGWFDLWTTNHGALPSLFLNQQDGTFLDIAQSVVPAPVWDQYLVSGGYDAHGVAWLDVDRDGDMDLYQSGDGNFRNQPSQLLINNNGVNFSADIAADAGIDARTTSTRRPLGLDWNLDGFVDLFVYSAENPAVMSPLQFFESNHSSDQLSFSDVTAQMGMTSDSNLELGIISDLDNDNVIEVTTGPTPNFLSVFEIEQGMATDITASSGLLGSTYMVDGAVADFDGDLDQDLYAVRGVHPRDLVQVNDSTLEATLYVRTVEEGMSFVTSGDVSFALFPNYQIPLSRIFIGATGYNLQLPIVGDSHNFTLSSDDPANHGIAPHIHGSDYGHYIGFDPETGRWILTVSSSGATLSRNIVISSTQIITEVETIGFSAGASAAADLYYRNDNGTFVSSALGAGFSLSSSARSVAAGDFDNDADVDLYVVSTSIVQNKDNILYLNDGNGVFTKALDMGAEGPIEGRGDSVSIADYDNDGFLDLFVSNGKDKPPFFYDGPYNLFRNLGNENHWVQINLVGTESEIQGIGAKIVTTTNDVSQLRMHGNASNARSQHMTRSHFGLGSATVIDEIHVSWPSGKQQKWQAVAVDQILTITEPLVDVDSDSDGAFDAVDNCLNVSNPDQQDDDRDGFGNVCDADFNNDCQINFLDLALLAPAFLSTNSLFDLNADGVVNFLDVAQFADVFLSQPGPSGTSFFCTGSG